MTRRLPVPLHLGAILGLTLVLALGWWTVSLRPVSAAPAGRAMEPRLVILGFDGADGRTIEGLLETRPDEYPNFRRLRDSGTFARLQTISPPESPVSWAAFNTGKNPAKTGVPGFVRRTLERGAPLPTFGHMTDERRAVESFANTPIPTWSAATMALVLGGGTLVLFLLLFAVLFKMRPVLAVALSVGLGGVGGWCGHTLRGLLPDEVPRTANPIQSRNFWDHAGDAGIESIVLDAAQAFDMPAGANARVLAGLGVPDARGGLGDWFLYTTKETEYNEAPDGKSTPTAGTVFRVYEREGEIRSKVFGPKNFWAIERLERTIRRLEEQRNDPDLDYATSLDLIERKQDAEGRVGDLEREPTSVDLVVHPGPGHASIRLGDEEQDVAVGEWSDYYHLTFELNWLLEVHAVTRVKLVQLEPHFELFVNVLDIDPEQPPFWQAISAPFAFSSELARSTGTFETYGWPTATMPLKDGIVTPELLMEDVEFTMKWRERLAYSSLERDDWRLFMCVFSTTDRVQHMMYQYYDELHPLYDEEQARVELDFFGERITRKEAIPAIYRQMDRIIGTVMDQHLGPNDTLFVCSDHGFQSFRRQVHVNNMLHDLGYLALRPGTTPRTGNVLAFVDWKNTRAYCVGLGFIYLNLRGREPEGIVNPDEADELMRQIRADMLLETDEETGERICNDVYLCKDVHSGPHLDLEADLICGFAPTYRVSWGTTLGGIHLVQDDSGGWVPGPVCVDNDKSWSGGHVSVATPDVAGVFFSNREVEIPEGGLELLHVAPTTLQLLGVPIPEDLDLPPVTVR